MEECLSKKSRAMEEREHSNKISKNKTSQLLEQVVNSVELSNENNEECSVPINCSAETMNPHMCRLLPSKLNHLDHLKNHSVQENNVCEERERTFSKKRDLIYDLGVDGIKKSHDCDPYGKPFKDLKTLNSQFLSPTEETLDNSDICSDSNNSNSKCLDIPVNMNTCVSEVYHNALDKETDLKSLSRKKYKTCDICKKTLAKSTDLKRHLRIHTKVKPHICDVCNKPFAQISTLTNHLLIHTKEKSHICNVCSKAFARRGDLKAHLLTHTKEKLHVCDVCKKAFTHSSNLKHHLLTHTKEKPHVCCVCSKAFSHNCNLKRHLLTHCIQNTSDF